MKLAESTSLLFFMNFVVELTRYQMMRWSVASITTWFGTERRMVPMVVMVMLGLLFLLLLLFLRGSAGSHIGRLTPGVARRILSRRATSGLARRVLAWRILSWWILAWVLTG